MAWHKMGSYFRIKWRSNNSLMSSLFDMNPNRPCEVCYELHPVTARCNYDLLIKIVHALKLERKGLMMGVREAHDIANKFQNVIRSIEPELARLIAVELKYKKLIGELPGTEKLQTEESPNAVV